MKQVKEMKMIIPISHPSPRIIVPVVSAGGKPISNGTFLEFDTILFLLILGIICFSAYTNQQKR